MLTCLLFQKHWMLPIHVILIIWLFCYAMPQASTWMNLPLRDRYMDTHRARNTHGDQRVNTRLPIPYLFVTQHWYCFAVCGLWDCSWSKTTIHSLSKTSSSTWNNALRLKSVLSRDQLNGSKPSKASEVSKTNSTYNSTTYLSICKLIYLRYRVLLNVIYDMCPNFTSNLTTN